MNASGTIIFEGDAEALDSLKQSFVGVDLLVSRLVQEDVSLFIPQVGLNVPIERIERDVRDAVLKPTFVRGLS